MKIAFVGCLHPEKGFNQDMFQHLGKVVSDGYVLYILGDTAQYPNSYKKLRATWISGNHDDDSGVESVTVQYGGGKILLIHGHQWDPDCRDKSGWFDQISAFAQFHIGAEEFSLIGRKLISDTVDSSRPKFLPQKHKGCANEPGLLWSWYKDHDATASVIVYAHKHSQFYFTQPNGSQVINVGAGWRGEYVTLEEDGVFYFHWFNKAKKG